MQVTFHGKRMRLLRLPIKVGTRARDVRLIDNNLSSVLPLERSRGKVRLFVTLPSLDMPVYSAEIRKFSQRLTLLSQELTDSIEVFLISADLPFAQTRWQAIEKVTNITLLSDYRDLDFARNWGLLIADLGLLAHAVCVVDSTGIVTYQEIVADLTDEPDYGVAFAALAAEMTTVKAAS